jgi:hypothetical protein
MNRVRFPLMTLEYIAVTAMLAAGALVAGSWVADAITARLETFCNLMR